MEVKTLQETEGVHVDNQPFSTQEIAESPKSWLLRVWDTCCVHGIDLDQDLEDLTLFNFYNSLLNPPAKYADDRTCL
jgi:hypothetical protein